MDISIIISLVNGGTSAQIDVETKAKINESSNWVQHIVESEEDLINYHLEHYDAA